MAGHIEIYTAGHTIECSAAKFCHLVVSDGKFIALELGPPAIDRPPLACDHVHHWFKIRSGKID